jgi:hypothetical protein
MERVTALKHQLVEALEREIAARRASASQTQLWEEGRRTLHVMEQLAAALAAVAATEAPAHRPQPSSLAGMLRERVMLARDAQACAEARADVLKERLRLARDMQAAAESRAAAAEARATAA